jgi:hypothetical protein
MKSTRTLLAAGAALAIVGAAVWLIERGPARDRDLAARDAAHRSDGADGGPLVPASGADGSAPLAATRESEAAHAAESNGAEVVPLPAPGKVHVKIADTRTQAPLDHVRVRFANETRFAESGGDHEVTATLTSGAWEASVGATGFEPARIGPFEVKAGETLELGTVALGRGVGVVEGTVTALHLDRDHPVVVQLFGDGRSPCDRCLELQARPPVTANEVTGQEPVLAFGSDCAYSEARDELSLPSGRTFRFEHLAAGIYFLRAFDPAQRIVDARRIELGRGGRSWQELDVSAPTRARFELRHGPGGLFTGAWSAVHQAAPASIHYEFRRNGRAAGAVDVAPSADDCLASVGPPIAIPGREPAAKSNQRQFVVSLFRAIQSQISANDAHDLLVSTASAPVVLGLSGPAEDRDDRARAAADELLFDGGEPQCEDVALQAKAVRPDLHEISPLPRSELTVVVSCGHYRSAETPLDLRADPFEPFVIALELDPDIASRLSEIRKGPPASCVACHGSEAPTDGKVVYGAPQSEITIDFGDLGSSFQLGDNVEIQLPDLSPNVVPAPSGDSKPADDH